MMAATEKQLRTLAIVFAVSLVACWALGFLGPRLAASPGQIVSMPQWMFWVSLFFGLVAAITVPFAWRWLKWRRVTKPRLNSAGHEA
jgi:hypothetical protein